MTPPALARMSGTTSTLRASSTPSASGVIGPLAPSTTSRALILPALLPVICASNALGTRMSQGTSSSSSFVMRLAPGNPVTEPCSSLNFSNARGSRPFGFCTPPEESLAATIRHPWSCKRYDATAPTLPNPCTATFAPASGIPRCRVASRVTKVTPRPVASTRPKDPPIASGLPVTTEGVEYPRCMLYVSMIHAMICGFVPTSGAGMSPSGLIRMPISVAYRRVRCSSSSLDSPLGFTTTPPLAPP